MKMHFNITLENNERKIIEEGIRPSNLLIDSLSSIAQEDAQKSVARIINGDFNLRTVTEAKKLLHCLRNKLQEEDSAEKVRSRCIPDRDPILPLPENAIPLVMNAEVLVETIVEARNRQLDAIQESIVLITRVHVALASIEQLSLSSRAFALALCSSEEEQDAELEQWKE